MHQNQQQCDIHEHDSTLLNTHATWNRSVISARPVFHKIQMSSHGNFLVELHALLCTQHQYVIMYPTIFCELI